MNARTILITGGAGFVGSHTADLLLKAGHTIRIFDNLSPQVHSAGLPSYLPSGAQFIQGDICNLAQLREAVIGADVIFHLAAAVGVGQSMYEIADYTATNNLGTANLLQAILDTRSEPEKLVVASSMSIYGEGMYLCQECGEVAPPIRPIEQMKKKQWEAVCPNCGDTLVPVPTREEKPLQCSSIYALSKKDQEEMTLLFGRTYGIAVVALRYFNIYGTRQSLSNPYTGVAAIFASRLLNRNVPLIFEDGEQMRDFVSVHDIARANMLAMQRPQADGKAINIGTGEPVTIRGVAEQLVRALGSHVLPEFTGKYRAGDIRHCFADISAARQLLGYEAKTSFKAGIEELAGWLQAQQANDSVEEAMERLAMHGLVA